MVTDVLLLMECRKSPPQPKDAGEDVPSPTPNQIDAATAHVPKRNDDRDPDPTNTSSDVSKGWSLVLTPTQRMDCRRTSKKLRRTLEETFLKSYHSNAHLELPLDIM